jgi:hypothetical protein
MKKLIGLFVLFCFTLSSFGSAGLKTPPLLAADVLIPLGNTGKTISLLELSEIKVKDFQALSGKKMNIWNRLMFKRAQKELRAGINEDGTINNQKVKSLVKKAEGEGFHLGGFALGFFVGLIGVLIAYLINDDKKQDRVKWSWIGFGAGVVLGLLLILIVF